MFRKAAHLLRHRSTRTTFQWIKGHTGNQGNEGSDQLAKQGAETLETGMLNLEIPMEFDMQGAKLAMLTQVEVYRGILEKKIVEPQNTTENNLQLTREVITRITGDLETSTTIWHSLQKQAINPIIQQFLFKTMHGTYKTGRYWRKIPECEERETCKICNTTESMEHNAEKGTPN